MKKIFALILAVVLALTLAACTETSPAPTSSETPSISPSNTEAAEEPGTSDNTDPQGFQRIATIEETVLFNESDVCITATGLNYSDYAVELTLLIENNSSKELSFVSNSIGYSCNSVNGYMIEDGYMLCDVAAGKKANETLHFDYDNLMLYGIFEIADIEIGFDISDEDYNHIYSGPCRIETSIAASYDYETPHYREAIVSEATQNHFGYTVPYFSEDIMYEQGGLSVLSNGFIVNSDGEPALFLEVANTSPQAVTVKTSDIYLNGLGVYPFTWSSDTINPGKTAILDLELSAMLDDNFWDIYGLQDIATVSLAMGFENLDGDDLNEPAVISVSLPDSSPAFSRDGEAVYDSNGVKIVMKDIVEDSLEFSDDMYILLLVENNTADTISLREVYDSFSLNGYMMDCSVSSIDVKSGTCAVLEIMLWASDLEENAITGVADISEFEIEFEIEAGDTTIDTAHLNVAF